MNAAETLALQAGNDPHRPFAASIARLPRRFRPGSGDVGVQVHVATTGPEPGNWLVRISGDSCRVFMGSIATPDARLFTSSEVGHEILTGALPVDVALSSGLLDYDGDSDALRRFGACFELGGAL